MSLRRRLLLGLLVISAVLVLTNISLSNRFHAVLLDRVDRQLIDTASRDVFGGGRGGPGGPGAPPRPGDETLSEYFIAVGDPSDGTLIQLSSALAAEDQSPPRLEAGLIAEHLTGHPRAAQPFTVPALTGSSRWRLVAVELGGDRVTVVGLGLDELEATVDRIRVVQILGTLAVLSSLGLVAWWVLRLGVHPIESMAVTADAIAQGDLSRRVDHPGERTEVGRLGLALNAMLGTIEEAFRAREASEARVRRFAADASHELRTPLTSILGYAELWRAGGLRQPAALSEAMRRMEQEAKRMAALVEDLLLLARLDQHRTPTLAPVRFDEIVADGVRDARAVEPDRPITCDVRPVVVEGDELQLRQIVANLLANARVHTPTGSAVHVSLAHDGGTARLVVADEGPGMNSEVAGKVFERFYRADPSRARAGGGTGLGLAIVEAAATGHGGGARVESEPGKGSRFVVELPGARPSGNAADGSIPDAESPFARPASQ